MSTDRENDALGRRVRSVIEDDDSDIRDHVRDITLEALSHGRLDADGVGAVLNAVLKGVREATAVSGSEGRQKLADAVEGLDEALAVAAEAADLAIREAAGRSSEFSRQELRLALDELAGLETRFIETMSRVAHGTSGFAAVTLKDLAEHARSSGTLVGGRVQSSLATLREAVAETASTGAEAGTAGLRTGGALLADIASGLLAGVADRLRPKSTKTGAGPTGPGG